MYCGNAGHQAKDCNKAAFNRDNDSKARASKTDNNASTSKKPEPKTGSSETASKAGN